MSLGFLVILDKWGGGDEKYYGNEDKATLFFGSKESGIVTWFLRRADRQKVFQLQKGREHTYK